MQSATIRQCSKTSQSAAAAPRMVQTRAASVSTPQQVQASQVFHYTQFELETKPGIALFDITPDIRQQIQQLGVTEGFVNVVSRHTTTAVAINEYETRLLDDIRQCVHTIEQDLCGDGKFLRKMAPPSDPYLHNDLHLREAPAEWPGGWEAWSAQEPENAHSHLLSMVLGTTETIPITKGQLALGTWQSVMLVELDGPRKRTVGIQVVGHTSSSA